MDRLESGDSWSAVVCPLLSMTLSVSRAIQLLWRADEWR
nr:hypothetical protein [Kibdelosporangium sp. MJ126-NF4]CTQ92483.1 hypothetical protein [Kibdelosporangium sp. MJ126-NF4]